LVYLRGIYFEYLESNRYHQRLRLTILGEQLKNSAIHRALILAMASALLAIGSGASPALADAKAADSDTNVTEVKLTYGDFDKQVAKANGYDIRKDDRGVEYSILATTPRGDLTGAKYIPGQEPSASRDGVTTFNTTWGDCGLATFTGAGRSFYTAWAITDLTVGPAYYHEWRVAVSSGYGYQTWNLDGLSNGYSWSTYRDIPFNGYPYNGYVSHGKVSTAFGFACYAYNPSDQWSS
jgi:hypothetical protein